MSTADRVAELECQLANLTAAETARKVWDAAAEARGPQPGVPMAPEAPRPPMGARPDFAAARAVLATQDGIARDRQRADLDVERARQRVTDAEQQHAELDAEACRVRAYVVALRAAPSELLRRQLAQIGSMGRFRVTVDDGEVIAEIQNARGQWVPALDASRGERLAAGLDLRAALRAAAAQHLSPAYAAVPLILDNRQDADADVPLDARAPVVALVTAAGDLATSTP